MRFVICKYLDFIYTEGIANANKYLKNPFFYIIYIAIYIFIFKLLLVANTIFFCFIYPDFLTLLNLHNIFPQYVLGATRI